MAGRAWRRRRGEALPAQAPAVAALCAKHGLAYEACGMAEGTRRVLACLAAVARLA